MAAGAVRAATVAEALTAGGPVVLSLTDYQAMYDILTPAADALTGRTIVNLSSDTPARTTGATDAAREVDTGEYPGADATVTMMGATVDHIATARARRRC